VVIGAVIAGASGYYQSKRQQEYEYRKDLAAAIRTAYADFLKAVF
jgi:methionine synthase II (cobalamin-independent)